MRDHTPFFFLTFLAKAVLSVSEYPSARKTASCQFVCDNLQGRPSKDVQGTDRIFYIRVPGAAERVFGDKEMCLDWIMLSILPYKFSP